MTSGSRAPHEAVLWCWPHLNSIDNEQLRADAARCH